MSKESLETEQTAEVFRATGIAPSGRVRPQVLGFIGKETFDGTLSQNPGSVEKVQGETGEACSAETVGEPVVCFLEQASYAC